jgi:hypothetical protein
MTIKELRKLLRDPILIVLVGNVGTRKSFITSKLKNILNAEILSGDELSKERNSSNRGNPFLWDMLIRRLTFGTGCWNFISNHPLARVCDPC